MAFGSPPGKPDILCEWPHTGKHPVQVEIFDGNVSDCEHLRTTHEEANTIVIQQLVVFAPKNAIGVADDTDIFVLLLHFNFTGDIQSEIMPNLLAAQGLSGCDTAGPYCTKGKKNCS